MIGVGRTGSSAARVTRTCRWFVAGLTVAALVAFVAVAEGSPGAAALPRLVRCDDGIGNTRFPYVANGRPELRYRTVLQVVSAPPAFMQQVEPTQKKPWRFWHKQGLIIRTTGESLTVSVPAAWRSRAAIIWGNGGLRPTSALRFEGCYVSARVGRAYAGGFLLRSRSACVPLVFRVGSRSATLRFGVGQRCRA